MKQVLQLLIRPFFFISWFTDSSDLNFGHFQQKEQFCFCLLFFSPPMSIHVKIKKNNKKILVINQKT